jgi:hypothetical protein
MTQHQQHHIEDDGGESGIIAFKKPQWQMLRMIQRTKYPNRPIAWVCHKVIGDCHDEIIRQLYHELTDSKYDDNHTQAGS